MTATVPISRSSYASTTADEAWDVLSQMYTRARPRAGSTDVAIRFNGAATSDIAVDRGYLHTAEGSFDECPDQLNIITVTSGRISLDFGRRGIIANVPGDSYLYLPDSSAELEWQDFGALTLRVPPHLVAFSAAEQTGIPPGELRFMSPRPLSTSYARLWLATIQILWREFTAPDCDAVHPLMYRELLNMTAATVISAFPNTAMTRGYVSGPGDVRPAALRRAVAYIDAQASLPITVTDIADAAGTTAYALRVAFRRHLDTTPTDYLRRARLEGAHANLQAEDPHSDLTVREIAARWGFANAARFSQFYRASYGRSPVQTLRT